MLRNKITQSTALSGTDYKIQKGVLERNAERAPLKSGHSVEVKIEANWGGKDGSDISVGVSGEIHDDKGNYVEGEIKQDSSGEGSATVSAGHEE